jgi:hypothetical protein
MGQMTTGILLGHIGRPPQKFEDGWYTLIDKYKAPKGLKLDTPSGDGPQGLGFWIAVGASGEDGVPDLPDSIAFDAIETTRPYAATIKAAREAWPALVAWAETVKPKRLRGPLLPAEPRLWLVQTEVA